MLAPIVSSHAVRTGVPPACPTSHGTASTSTKVSASSLRHTNELHSGCSTGANRPTSSHFIAVVTQAMMWLLVGRFRPVEHPLWSSFVWRNELADTFVEVLAVPWLVGPASGTPVLTAWLETMGASIGRGVWLESYWLPESDLVRLGDGATVN